MMFLSRLDLKLYVSLEAISARSIFFLQEFLFCILDFGTRLLFR
jgi:hypothetical protein